MKRIENEHLIVEVNPVGAELNSLQDKQDDVEHMWSGDSRFWASKAPILFPCVGESKHGQVMFGGNAYPMERHGFARKQKFRCVEHVADKLVFELIENEETLKSYPFSFRFEVSYRLKGRTLEQRFTVENTGTEMLGYQLGGHPAFAVPFGVRESFSDYCIRFDSKMHLNRHLLDAAGLYSGEQRNVLHEEDTISLTYELFNEDALVFKDIPSKKVWIQNKAGSKRLQVDYEGFPHLGIWSKPGANYVCIEPWIGCADNFDQESDFYMKDNVQELKPGEQRSAGFTVSVLH